MIWANFFGTQTVGLLGSRPPAPPFKQNSGEGVKRTPQKRGRPQKHRQATPMRTLGTEQREEGGGRFWAGGGRPQIPEVFEGTPCLSVAHPLFSGEEWSRRMHSPRANPWWRRTDPGVLEEGLQLAMGHASGASRRYQFGTACSPCYRRRIVKMAAHRKPLCVET